MNLHPTRSEHHTLRPSELAAALAHFVEARQPCIVWGPPGPANSMIAHQVAAATNRQPLDIQTLLLDPAHFRGIPRHDGTNPTQSSLPAFLPPSHDTGRWLINLQDLPSTAPPVQATLYQLLLDRHFGDYELPDHASLIASGSRETHPGAVHRMPTPLAPHFAHLDLLPSRPLPAPSRTGITVHDPNPPPHR